MRKAILAVFLTLTVVTGTSGLVAAQSASGPDLDFENDKTPDPTIHEDELTVAEHDRSEMNSSLQYYDDDGNIAELPATVNDSQDTPVGVRFDQIDADAYDQFPRTADESGNSATWANSSDWTTESDTDSSVDVSQADSNGIERVNIDATAASGESATANISDDIDIDSDPNKRVMMAVVNVDELSADSEVEIRAVDEDGDYRSANISESADADGETTIANSTGDGYVFQSKVDDLEGSGDLDEIAHVEVVTSDADAEVTIAGLDLDGKSERDLGEIQRDGEDTTVTNYYEGGVADLTSIDSLGPMYDDATINDLRVYDVEYRFSDLTDEGDYQTEFGDSDRSYPSELDLYADLSVPSAIDLSHGDLTVEYEQGFVEDRYATAEVATNVDSDEGFGNLSDDDYTSWKSELGSVNETATIGVAASGETYRVHMVVSLKDDEVSALQATGGAFGPTGGSGGSGILSWIAGAGAAIVGGLGLRRIFGSG
ncbi:MULTISPECIES: hypothetical protein [Haloarcula]|uniref:hypothetical protein n=1 Tax=Haloarcula TaxID=2237 RepID=UPI0023E894DD|nr:hypothetical protein [Halomicroarcula sp. SHR3]